jgi:hypothetical protein
MITKRAFMLFILIQVYSFMFAQKDTNNFVIKAFYNVSYSYYQKSYYFSTYINNNTVPSFYGEALSKEYEYSIGYFSFAYEKYTKKGNSIEVELMPFRYNKLV